MSRAPNAHPAERLDLSDYLHAARDFPKEYAGIHESNVLLDMQSRILRGFRVEIANQATYPGRITVHGGFGIDKDGRILFNDNQLQISRTITLEGASATFYVELTYIESDSDVDARAFWDPTVDQGTYPSGDEKPDGQEAYTNAATRKASDWSIVIPVSTTGFSRNLDPTSTRVPIIKLETNGSNEVVNVTTEKPATTLLEVIAPADTKIRVVNAQLFKTGTGSDIQVGAGLGTVETRTINAISIEAGILELSSPLSNSHDPGEIIKATGTSAIDVVVEGGIGRYRRNDVATADDFRDMLFQGDEVHGSALVQGHNTAAVTDRSDVNLQTLKDRVDFMSAQIQEMKWGVGNPYVDMVDVERMPPGVDGITFPTTPRYFDRSGGIQGARSYAITVGDGETSFGDFNSDDGTAIQAAIDAMTGGGTIYVKQGTYDVATTITIDKSIDLVFDRRADIKVDTGTGVAAISVEVPGGFGDVAIKNMHIHPGSVTPSEVGVEIITHDLLRFELSDCWFDDVGLDVGVALPLQTYVQRTTFIAVSNMTSRAMIQTTAVGSKISGNWSNCSWWAISAGLTASCFDGVNGSPTQAFKSCNFVDCSFIVPVTSNTSMIHLGDNSNIVYFVRCGFIGLGGVYIKATGGSVFKIVDCIGSDGFTGLINATDAYDIEIKGYFNGVFSGLPQMYFEDCERIRIHHCTVHVNGIVPNLFSCFEFVCTSSPTERLKEFEISNCTVTGDAITLTASLAVYFKILSGQGFENVKIMNNEFLSLEHSINFFQFSGTGGIVNDVHIRGNTFIDKDPALSNLIARTQKVVIFAGPDFFKNRWSITDNSFSGMNPPNADWTQWGDRCAIAIRGTLNRSEICNNQITNVGVRLTPTNIASGIMLESAAGSVISNNNIDYVEAKESVGIWLGAGTDQSINDMIISNNNVDNINSFIAWGGVGNYAYGIKMSKVWNTLIANNAFGLIDPLQASWGAAIYSNNTTVAASIYNLSIIGNTFESGNDRNNFVYLRCQDASDICISNNMANSVWDGVNITSNTSTIDQVVIDNNKFTRVTATGVYFKPNNTSHSNYVSIIGNLINGVVAAGLKNIQVETVDYLTVSNNTLICANNNNNIALVDCIWSTINGNVCKKPAGVPNIYVTGDSDVFSISTNTCEGNTISTEDATTGGLLGGVLISNVTDETIKHRSGTDSFAYNVVV